MKIVWSKDDNISVTAYRPSEPCDFCGTQEAGEPNSFATLSGGGLLKKGQFVQRRNDYIMSPKVHGFLSLQWHGADSDCGGVGDNPDVTAEYEVIESQFEGQYELYFCSTDCLRCFLNECVDELEQEIQDAVIEKGQSEEKS